MWYIVKRYVTINFNTLFGGAIACPRPQPMTHCNLMRLMCQVNYNASGKLIATVSVVVSTSQSDSITRSVGRVYLSANVTVGDNAPNAKIKISLVITLTSKFLMMGHNKAVCLQTGVQACQT